MKLINSRKDIDDLIKEKSETYLYDDNEEEQHSPCWEVKIDRDCEKAMIFLIDGEEQLSCPLSKLDESYFTIEKISEFIGLLRNGEFDKMKEVLGMQ